MAETICNDSIFDIIKTQIDIGGGNFDTTIFRGLW